MARGARRTDLAGSIKARLRALRARLERPETLIETLREANASRDPVKVASWLVRQADEWLPAPCWATVVRDPGGADVILAENGLIPAMTPSVTAVSGWVLRHGVEFFSANLAEDTRLPKDLIGTAIAFPLICRHETIGVLVGMDGAPSSAVPSLSAPIVPLLRTVLEPPSIALDNTLALQRAEALSVTDDLTRLYNSRYLNQVLRRETKRAARSGRPLSLLFLDLDGFKGVNDQHGHLAGSKALVEAAEIIRRSARETDIPARFGGDEFAVILPDTARDGAIAVAERIRDRVRTFPFLATDGLTVRLTASIGVATLPDVALSADELLSAADAAMYKVKAAGKNGIFVMETENRSRKKDSGS